MALVFQYGSNLSSQRLNGNERLRGGARIVGTARTTAPYRLDFTVWSPHNQCAAADLVEDAAGRSIYGVVYDIPDRLVFGYHDHMTLDRIENEGESYGRESITVVPDFAAAPLTAETYRVRRPRFDLITAMDYVQHLLNGMQEHGFPVEYQGYVVRRIVENNPGLMQEVEAFLAANSAVERRYF